MQLKKIADESVLRLFLFNITFSDQEEGMRSVLVKQADGAALEANQTSEMTEILQKICRSQEMGWGTKRETF